MANQYRRRLLTLSRDIIDFEPATEDINKMILGSLSTFWDGIGSPTVTSDDSQSRTEPGEWPVAGTEGGRLNSPGYLHERYTSDVDRYILHGQPTDFANSKFETDYSGTQFDHLNSRTQSQLPNVISSNAGQSQSQVNQSRHRRGTRDSSFSSSTIQYAGP